METPDFSRSRIDTMINLRHPLAVLATRLPWGVIEAVWAPQFGHKDRGPVSSSRGRTGHAGPDDGAGGCGRSNAGRGRRSGRWADGLMG